MSAGLRMWHRAGRAGTLTIPAPRMPLHVRVDDTGETVPVRDGGWMLAPACFTCKKAPAITRVIEDRSVWWVECGACSHPRFPMSTMPIGPGFRAQYVQAHLRTGAQS